MRLVNWQSKFAEITFEVQSKRFKWGEHDCCLWAANCTQAITGTDFAVKWRGQYSDSDGAFALIKEGGSLTDMVSSALGFQPVHPNFANVGDVVLLVTGGKEALGVCNGTSILIPSRTHMANLPMSAALKVWKI